MGTSSNLFDSTESQSFIVSSVLSEYCKPIFDNRFFTNKEYLIENSDYVDIRSSNLWFLRPEKFCLDVYNIPDLYPVILTVNNVGSRFLFRPENFKNNYVIAPKISAIRKVAIS